MREWINFPPALDHSSNERRIILHTKIYPLSSSVIQQNTINPLSFIKKDLWVNNITRAIKFDRFLNQSESLFLESEILNLPLISSHTANLPPIKISWINEIPFKFQALVEQLQVRARALLLYESPHQMDLSLTSK